MNTSYNPERPLIMHVDLNSCFASIEQQSRPLLRNRPVAVVNRATEHTAIVTASYEAKALGVKVGMRFKEARQLVPDIVGIESDPPKYRYVYRKLLRIMQDYSAHVKMKSIDEGVIDFHQSTKKTLSRDMFDIGLEIKERLKSEVGEYMRCNVGIASNRFLAKTAAGLNKPDGMDLIDAHTLRSTLAGIKLRDLTGIAYRNERRLNAVGIYTPLEFLDTSPEVLKHMVFESVVGEWWYKRLRGWEVDDVDYPMRRVGRQYVLERRDMLRSDIIRRLQNLGESVGGRLRKYHLAARGIYVYARSPSVGYWHTSRMTELPFFTNETICALATSLLEAAPDDMREIGLHCYKLEPQKISQLSLFGDALAREQARTRVVDSINDRYGERTIHAASTLGTERHVSTKISFGGTRFL